MTSIFGFATRVILNRRFLYGKDNAAYDLSLHGMQRWNSLIQENKSTRESKGTFYFAFVTRRTEPIDPKKPNGRHKPANKMHPLLKRFGADIGNFNKKLNGIQEFVPAQWWESDGAAPVISQGAPWLGICRPPKSTKLAMNKWPRKPVAGDWYVESDVLKGFDHTDIVVFPESWRQKRKQKYFYKDLMDNLWTLPK